MQFQHTTLEQFKPLIEHALSAAPGEENTRSLVHLP